MHELSVAGERRAAARAPGRAATGGTADGPAGTGPLLPPGAPHHGDRDEAAPAPPTTAPTETGAPP